MFKVYEEFDGFTMSGFGKCEQYLTFNRLEGSLLIFDKENGEEYTTFVDVFLRGFVYPTMDGVRFYLTCDNTMTKDDVEKLVRDYKQTLQN
jgi:hypothetical protein